MVMDVLTEDVRDGLLMQLLYADDFSLCVEPLNEVMDKYGKWKNGVKGKGLRVRDEGEGESEGSSSLFCCA